MRSFSRRAWRLAPLVIFFLCVVGFGLWWYVIPRFVMNTSGRMTPNVLSIDPQTQVVTIWTDICPLPTMPPDYRDALPDDWEQCWSNQCVQGHMATATPIGTPYPDKPPIMDPAQVTAVYQSRLPCP